MTFLPTPFTVGVRVFEPGAVDDFGEPLESWADPVNAPVYGWAPASTSEPFEVGREPVEWDLDLYVPPGFVCGPEDRISVLGAEYTVQGVLESFDFGPFGFTPGGRVRLKRVEG